MHRLNVVPNKEMDKLMPKLTWKTKGPSLAEMLWRKTNKNNNEE